jgi:hypothetical protein
VPTLLGVERAEGGNSAPAVGQIAWIDVRERNGGGTKIEGGACKDGRKVSSKLGTVPGEEGGYVCKIIGEQPWRPRRKTACRAISRYTHIYKGQNLLLANPARRMKAVDAMISFRMAVFSVVLSKLPGTYNIALVMGRKSVGGFIYLLSPPKGNTSGKGSEVPSSML